MRKQRFSLMIAMIVAALTFYVAHPTAAPEYGAYAQTDINTKDQDGKEVLCTDLYPEARGGVFLGVIAPCIMHTIESATIDFSSQMIAAFEPLFYAFLTFVLTMFGVRVLQGERDIGPQAFMLLIKIAFVIGILEMIPYEIVPQVYYIMDNGVEITTSVLGDGSSINCEVSKYGDANTPVLWKQMDCVLGKLFGFATGRPRADGTPTTNMLLGASAVGLLSGFFFGGTLGIAVFFALIGVLWSVLSLVLNMLKAYLNGYLIVCVMLLIAPLFMPLVFLKVTTDYFDKWCKAILGGILLPVLVSAYAMFAFLMYDEILFKPESHLQKLFNQDLVQKALQRDTTPCDFNVTNDPSFKLQVWNGGKDISNMSAEDQKKASQDKEFTQAYDQLMKSPFLQNMVIPMLSGSSNACAMFKMPKFDLGSVDSKEFQDAQKAFVTLFKESVKLFILALLTASGFKTLEGVISSFTGSGLARVAMTAKSQVEQRAETQLSAIKESLQSSLGGVPKQNKDGTWEGGYKGAEFVNNINKAGKSAFAELLSGIIRK